MPRSSRPWTPGNYLTVPNRKIIFELPEGELKIYLALCDYADPYSGQCYPSFEKLALRAGYKRRHTINLIGKLVARGLIKVIKRRATLELNQSNIYQVMEIGGSAKLSALGSAKLSALGGSAKLSAPISKPTSLSKTNYLKEDTVKITDEEKARRRVNLDRLEALKRRYK